MKLSDMCDVPVVFDKFKFALLLTLARAAFVVCSQTFANSYFVGSKTDLAQFPLEVQSSGWLSFSN